MSVQKKKNLQGIWYDKTSETILNLKKYIYLYIYERILDRFRLILFYLNYTFNETVIWEQSKEIFVFIFLLKFHHVIETYWESQ